MEVLIKKNSIDNKYWFLPSEIFNLIKDKEKTTISLGNKIINAKIKKHRRKTINIPKKHFDDLDLIEGPINIKVENNDIRLGPIIGVFISPKNIKLIRNQQPNFRIKALSSENNSTILFFFSIRDVDMENKIIYGSYLNKQKNKWEDKIFSYPDILYDRGGGRLKSQRKISYEIRNNILENSNAKKFNSVYTFDKHEIFDRLIKYDELKDHIPKTWLYSEELLDELLCDYNSLYVKTCGGSSGKEVLKVQIKDHLYTIYYIVDDKLIKKDVDFDELVDIINREYGNSKKIIQEEIKSIKTKIDDKIKKIDFRVLIQRDGNNDIIVNDSVGRLGNSDYHVTSTKTGSITFKLKEMSRISDNLDIDEVEIKKFLKKLFILVEREYGRIGEVGVDFAVDENNNIWIIELNSKNSNNILYKTFEYDKFLEVYNRTIEYAIHLFKEKKSTIQFLEIL